MGFTALTLNSTRTPTSSVPLPRAGDGAQRRSFTFNYARYLRANVHRRGVYEAINGFCGWLNAQAEQRHLISSKAISSIMLPTPSTLFSLYSPEGEYSTSCRQGKKNINVLDSIYYGVFPSPFIEVSSGQVQQLHKFKWQVKRHQSLGSRRTPDQSLIAGSINHIPQSRYLRQQQSQRQKQFARCGDAVTFSKGQQTALWRAMGSCQPWGP